MRAIEYSKTGDPDVLSLADRPVPDPGPDEARVRIHRSGVNPTDGKIRRGAEPGTPVDPPQVPNQDGAGVIEAVGEGVESALHGLRVWDWGGRGRARVRRNCPGVRSGAHTQRGAAP